jgi:hypothetical protein
LSGHRRRAEPSSAVAMSQGDSVNSDSGRSQRAGIVPRRDVISPGKAVFLPLSGNTSSPARGCRTGPKPLTTDAQGSGRCRQAASLLLRRPRRASKHRTRRPHPLTSDNDRIGRACGPAWRSRKPIEVKDQPHALFRGRRRTLAENAAASAQSRSLRSRHSQTGETMNTKRSPEEVGEYMSSDVTRRSSGPVEG